MVPVSDPMVLENGAVNVAKTNAYRAGVFQAALTPLAALGSGQAYCQNLITLGLPRLLANKNRFVNYRTPNAAAGATLFRFLLNRFNQTLTNLNCPRYGVSFDPTSITDSPFWESDWCCSKRGSPPRHPDSSGGRFRRRLRLHLPCSRSRLPQGSTTSANGSVERQDQSPDPKPSRQEAGPRWHASELSHSRDGEPGAARSCSLPRRIGVIFFTDYYFKKFKSFIFFILSYILS